jgi:zinc transporter
MQPVATPGPSPGSAHAGLADSLFEAMDQGSRSTRIERDGDALCAVVNDVTFDFKVDASYVATLWVGVQRHPAITARRHLLRAADRLRMAAKRGEVLASSVSLLDHVLRDQADELQQRGSAAYFARLSPF